jgi:hypothetical protein
MVETVAREFPGLPLKAVVGGFHLAALPPFRGMSERAVTVAGIGQAVLDHGRPGARDSHRQPARVVAQHLGPAAITDCICRATPVS